MDLVNKKVLVTGAGGFIGSHLVELLLKKGAAVRAFVKYNGRNDWGMLSDLPEESLKNIEVVMGNICDPFFVRKAVCGCDYVFHLAALIGIPYSYVAAADYVMVNVQGTLNVLEACRAEGTTRMIHTSTSETYGTAQYVPIDEKHPMQGQSPYSASKIGADKMVDSYYKSFGVPAVIVRPFNTYGPRQSARAFIPTVITQALTREKLALGSLDPVRDMTYVKDTVEGFVAVGLCDKVIGQTVNLGVGKGETVGTMVNTILGILGKREMAIEQDPSRVRPPQSEVMRLISDNTKARELCGWKPRYSIEQGLGETIEWTRKNIHKYRSDRYVV
ncbi:MAG: GDP-mannose 4,6-dehydratase [Planctomycetales bacterium]|nr:GDP-mannose 4,6-dehydratase [Planctomycetales bacterium]